MDFDIANITKCSNPQCDNLTSCFPTLNLDPNNNYNNFYCCSLDCYKKINGIKNK